MSTATSLANPLSKLITQCPYCDHVSPPGSKFCGECGAALHLMPCPHCGAVNDVTVATACYRCHKELHDKSSAAPVTSMVATPVADDAPAENMPYVIVEPPARQRPPVLVFAIVLLAFAAASYYAYRQRNALDNREAAPPTTSTAPAAVPVDVGTTAGTNAGTGTIIKSAAEPAPKPAPVEAKTSRPDAEPAREPVAATRSGAVRSTVAREAIEPPAAMPPAPTPASTTDITRARIEASKGLEKQAPYAGPCTDAVAALGLCTPEPTPRRQ